MSTRRYRPDELYFCIEETDPEVHTEAWVTLTPIAYWDTHHHVMDQHFEVIGTNLMSVTEGTYEGGDDETGQTITSPEELREYCLSHGMRQSDEFDEFCRAHPCG